MKNVMTNRAELDIAMGGIRALPELLTTNICNIKVTTVSTKNDANCPENEMIFRLFLLLNSSFERCSRFPFFCKFSLCLYN